MTVRTHADGDHKHVFLCECTVICAYIPKLGRRRQQGLEPEFSLGLENSKNMKNNLAKIPFQITV